LQSSFTPQFAGCHVIGADRREVALTSSPRRSLRDLRDHFTIALEELAAGLFTPQFAGSS
jgi:hypothetical protein